ncbi:MAG: CvpA family protein [Pseudomonadota bacterium]
MNGLDILVLVVLAGSILLGVMRGLVKEIFSLAAWVLAFIGARLFGGPAAQILPGVDDPSLRHVLALVLVFVVILVGAALAGRLLAGLVQWVGLGGVDRFLGVLFGAFRGGLILLALTLVAGMTALPKSTTWQGALTRPYLETSARWAMPWLPRDVSKFIAYS